MNSEQGEGRRNENVSLALIDNNVLKELNERLGHFGHRCQEPSD